MVGILILCILFGFFGISGLFFAIVGGLIKLSIKLVVFGVLLCFILLFGVPALLAGLFFGGLALLF
ncbi:MAG: hypothetical protein P1P65_04500 [Treponema sp.]